MTLLSESNISLIIWPLATVSAYIAARRIYRRWPLAILSPLGVAPVIIVSLALLFHTGYSEYIRATHWLLLLLGPAVVAFAIPVYEQRRIIRQYWPVLAFGVLTGSAVAFGSAWMLATFVGLDDGMRLSLMPRSISTPFAMTISGNIGGVPDLTAVFVAVTGVTGAVIGDMIMKIMPLRSSLSRGALLGMGAHAAGVARAHRMGPEEGSIAGLVMILVGIVNVLAAPFLVMVLR